MASKIGFLVLFLTTMHGAMASDAASGTPQNVQLQRGVGAGGGGDKRCQDYVALVSEMAIELVRIGQDKINAIDPRIVASDILSKIDPGGGSTRLPLQCLPNPKLNRAAWSDSDNNLTWLNFGEWDKLNRTQQFDLSTHELAVLVGLEKDGYYSLGSQSIRKILAKHANPSLRLRPRSTAITENLDGSFLIENPTTEEGFLYYSANKLIGVCKHLGFEQAFPEATVAVDNNVKTGYATAARVIFVSNDGALVPGRLVITYSDFYPNFPGWFSAVRCK